MCKIVKYGIVCVVLTGFTGIVRAQTVIPGPVVNEYSAVTDIDLAGRSVTVENAIFTAHDTVLLIQMTGIAINGNTPGAAGKYEFHVVAGVAGGGRVTFNGAIDPAFAPSPPSTSLTESVQLIRVPSYKNASVNQTLSCSEWNGKTGGVVVLMTEGTLTLNADIDVSGRGFRGGGISGAFDAALCGSASFPNPDYGPADSAKAGFKGEGAVIRQYLIDTPRGYAPAYNGGGGGNGKWSGGGGGANGGYGGVGDLQACETAAPLPDPVVLGGEGMAMKYDDDTWPQRAFPGGGGGSGTGENTPGGAGGGLVIIVAGSIQCTGGGIKANGGSPAGTVIYGGAGGGGGGGSVLLQIRNYAGGLKVDVNGGNGGDADRGTCSDDTRSRGAGGGGGGGVVYVTDDAAAFGAKPGTAIGFEGGNAGKVISVDQCSSIAGSGDDGHLRGGLVIPLKGFLYNYIATPDTAVCFGTAPTIAASQPQGGHSDYVYQWQRSDDKITWIPAGNSQNLITAPLTADNVFFRRIVSSTDADGSPVTDTCVAVTVAVIPEITNSLASADTTVCGYVPGIAVKGLAATGGNGTFDYRWEESLNGGGWQPIDGTSIGLTGVLKPDPVNTTEQRFRRTAVSRTPQRCAVTSNAVGIRILPVISGNDLGPDRRLCETAAVVTLGAARLSGGDNTEYGYIWQRSTDNKTWTDIPEATLAAYPPPKNPGVVHYYRRIVSSGSALTVGGYDCCRDTSAAPSLLYDRLPSRAAAGEDRELDFLFTGVLNANTPESGTGEWSLVKGEMTFADPAAASTTVSALTFGENEAQWKVSNGVCPADSARVVLRVKDITRYSGFSPNGDGINDCFRIDGVQNAESGELIVFNRHNNVVFRSASITKDDSGCVWDGRTSSGKDLPADTYYYQLTLNGNRVYKGYAVLKK